MGGSPQNKQTLQVNASTLASTIKNKLPTANTKLIRLLSCSNLESAKELSLALGRDIVATDGIVTLYKKGAVTSKKEWVRVNGCVVVDNNINTSNWKKAGENEGFLVLGGLETIMVPLDYDLALEAQALRRANMGINEKGHKAVNVAVIEYLDTNNNKKTLAVFSQPETRGKINPNPYKSKKHNTESLHAEEYIIHEKLKDNNISPDKVIRIYSELLYCYRCSAWVDATFTNLQSKTATFDLSEYDDKGEYKGLFRDYIKITFPKPSK